jgi:formate C-acetyltransferase
MPPPEGILKGDKMAYQLKPITSRVEKMRAKYRETQPEICTARYRLITDFYMKHPDMTGITKRARCLHHICENIPVRIDEDEVIVGAQSAKYRAAALYPENSVDWLKREVGDGSIRTRSLDPYILYDDDAEYIMDTVDFWMKECMSAKMDANIIDEYLPVAGNGVTMYSAHGNCPSPVGHFATGYNKAIRVGFKAIKEDADAKRKEYFDLAMPDNTIEKYNFYRAVSLVSDAAIILTKRYAALAKELAEKETAEIRKKELEMMAEGLSWTLENPARSFYEALQCLYMYHTVLCLDANMHGISFGRVDRYLGDFYKADVASGAITPEYGQELLDLFYLKIAELNKPWSVEATQSNPGYTNGNLMTLGGVNRDGSDAANEVTFMMLQTMGRLVLHDPPQALRIHKGTSKELWEAAIATTQICGGVPTFESDDAIIPALMDRGVSIEDARDFCLIGCVEPSVGGMEWPACGGSGSESYMNLANTLLLAINDGYTPVPMLDAFVPAPEGTANLRVGASTGYLYEMTSFEQVKDAFVTQTELMVKYHIMNTNSFEYVAREVLPLPIVSATMEGCMESGRDVMWGGAKYNSTGTSGVGLGNAAESLNMIKHCIFDKNICTAREMYDAIMSNWKGYEKLHNHIVHEAPHYGNGLPACDEHAAFVAKVFSEAVNKHRGPRGRYSAGLYPVTTNVMFGYITKATPDGRYAGQPLADGIAPVQAYDKNGPTSVVKSVSAVGGSTLPNGTLMNLKFHPTALRGEDGTEKLSRLIRTYFGLGGMELQINVVSADTLRAAQERPKEYKDLVVRVAGFSAYFVELHPDGQADLIRRTELAM